MDKFKFWLWYFAAEKKKKKSSYIFFRVKPWIKTKGFQLLASGNLSRQIATFFLQPTEAIA